MCLPIIFLSHPLFCLQTAMLGALGLQSVLFTDGKSPINIYQSSPGNFVPAAK